MILRAENIVKKYRKRTVGNGVSFELNQGEIVGLLGPNVAGKTTHCYIIWDLIHTFLANIFTDNTKITTKPRKKGHKNKMGI